MVFGVSHSKKEGVSVNAVMSVEPSAPKKDPADCVVANGGVATEGFSQRFDIFFFYLFKIEHIFT
jgi:hypothetical protein